MEIKGKLKKRGKSFEPRKCQGDKRYYEQEAICNKLKRVDSFAETIPSNIKIRVRMTICFW